MSTITLVVNGVPHRLEVADDDLLLDVLRDAVGVTSVREGCGVGACGACTVLVEGKSTSSCLALALRYDNRPIETAEAFGADDPVVAAFVEAGAMQCGYCIPAMVLMVHELLEENPAPCREDVVAHLCGNLCRCGTYVEILDAALRAARRLAGGAATSAGPPG